MLQSQFNANRASYIPKWKLNLIGIGGTIIGVPVFFITVGIIARACFWLFMLGFGLF